MKAFLRTVTGSPRQSPKKERNSLADLVKSWSSIREILFTGGTGALADRPNTPLPPHAALASLERHLDAIVDALAYEASVLSSDDSTGPCLEYVLANDVLSQLVKHSLSDTPTGILGLTIQTFDNLVILLDDDFVTFAHRPIRVLLRACSPRGSTTESHEISDEQDADGQQPTADDSNAGTFHHSDHATSNAAQGFSPEPLLEPYQGKLASLLCGLSSKIKTHPDLLPLFFHDKKVLSNPAQRQIESVGDANLVGEHCGDSESSRVTSPPTSARPSSTSPAATHEFHLFTMLLSFIHREGKTGDLARAGVLFIIDLAFQSDFEGTSGASRERKHSRKRPKSKLKPLQLGRQGQIDGHVQNTQTHRASSKQLRGEDHSPMLSPPISTSSDTSLRSSSPCQDAQCDLSSAQCLLITYLVSSGFADVIGAALGASYGLLPTRLFTPLGNVGKVESANDLFNEAEERRSEDLDRFDELRSEGFGSTEDPEFLDILSLWLKLIEFAQDVLRRMDISGGGSQRQMSESLQKHMQQARKKLEEAIRTAFIENTLQPTLQLAGPPSSSLAPSDPTAVVPSVTTTAHGTTLAILVYTNAMLSVLEAETALTDLILGFLLRADENVEANNVFVHGVEAARLAWEAHDKVTSTGNASHVLQGCRSSIRVPSKRSDLIELDSSNDTSESSVSPQPMMQSNNDSTASTSAARVTSGGVDNGDASTFQLKHFLLKVFQNTSIPTSEVDGQLRRASTIRALNLLCSVIAKFDYWSIEVLDVIGDVEATHFPFPVHGNDEDQNGFNGEHRLGEQAEEDEEFVYPPDDAESDTNSFTYPSLGSPETVQRRMSSSRETSHEKTHSILDLPPGVPSELEMLLQLVSSSQAPYLPSSPNAQSSHRQRDRTASIDQTGPVSTQYASYLRDAESAILQDPSFRRGILISSTDEEEDNRVIKGDLTQSAQHRVSANLPHIDLQALSPRSKHARGDSATIDVSLNSHSASSEISDELSGRRVHDPMLKHRLSLLSPLLEALLELLAAYFANPPEINLSLTAVLSKLAICPYRAIDGWLLPEGPRQLGKLDEAEVLKLVRLNDGFGDKRAGRDANPAVSTIEALRYSSLQPRPSPAKQKLQSSSSGAVFNIISHLFDKIQQYRSTIPQFDQYLEERRSGMMFVEDLNEALSGGGTAQVEQTNASSFFGQSLKGTPGISRSRAPTAQQQSGARLTRRRLDVNNDLSPYASHYRQTEGTSVEALSVETPLARERRLAERGWADDSEGAVPEYDPETPTRTHQGVGKSLVPEIKTSKDPVPEIRIRPTHVSLSATLDNVIILEEFLKELVAIVAVRRRLGIDSLY